jgi:hypothetical protein
MGQLKFKTHSQSSGFLKKLVVGEGEHKERMNEGEYGRHNLYSHMKTEE